MKIYTNTFDLRQPSEKKFWVAPYSDFKIGIKVIGAFGREVPTAASGIELYKDGEKLTVDSTDTDNDIAFWKIKSEGTGEVTYTVKAKFAAQASKYLGQFTLTQVVTDSTVYEQESGGEIPSDLDVTNLTAADSVETKYLRANYIYALSEGCTGCYTVFIDGCTGRGIFESIKTFDGGTVIQNDSIIIQSNNLPTLELNGGCGAVPRVSLYYGAGDEQVYISPSTGSQYEHKVFMFQPYFMQELNGGCGGYVLAAFT